MAKIDTGEALIRAALAAMRPYVRRMMQRGATFGNFEKRLRELFVEVAENEMAGSGNKQTDSRISLLTGLNRKEVRRIRGSGVGSVPPVSFTRNLAAIVVGRWLNDPSATSSNGRPLPIPYDAKRGPSFVKLARKTTVDLGPRALLQVLVDAGGAEIRKGDIIILKRLAYVPERGHPEALAMLKDDPPELIETMLHNVLGEGPEVRLQQKLAYDNLGKEGMERLRARLLREAKRFLSSSNKAFLHHDRDRSSKAPGGERTYAGIGVYYFESAIDGAAESTPTMTESLEKKRRPK